MVYLSTYANPLYSSLRLERRLKDGKKTQGSEKTQVKERRLKVGEKTQGEKTLTDTRMERSLKDGEKTLMDGEKTQGCREDSRSEKKQLEWRGSIGWREDSRLE